MDVLALETGEIELDGIGSDPRTMKERRRSSIRVSSAITGAEDQEDQEVQEGEQGTEWEHGLGARGVGCSLVWGLQPPV